MSFVVIRHPEAGIGTCSVDSLPQHKARGWLRVSEERAEPADFADLADYADAPNLDAPAPTPESEPEAKTAAKSKPSKETEAA